jgi:serine/threonine protein kinase
MSFFKCSHKNDDRAVDLLKKMLCLDARERITIAEALRHPFFREVKQKTQRIHDK